MIPLPTDFKELLQFLNEERVEYLVVGGYAVNFHGYHRSTADLDVWILARPENVEALSRALVSFGFSQKTVPPERFLHVDGIFRMGIRPLQIDIFASIKGVEFSDCYARREVACIDGVDIPFLGLEDLKASKKSAGRLKDLADVEELS